MRRPEPAGRGWRMTRQGVHEHQPQPHWLSASCLWRVGAEAPQKSSARTLRSRTGTSEIPGNSFEPPEKHHWGDYSGSALEI